MSRVCGPFLPIADGLELSRLGAGLPLRAVRSSRATRLRGAAALQASASARAIGVGGALRGAPALSALHPRSAVLVLRALGLRHADRVAADRTVGVRGAVGIVAALLAEAVDADLSVLRAVPVRLALRVLDAARARGHRQREAHQDDRAH